MLRNVERLEGAARDMKGRYPAKAEIKANDALEL